MTKYITDLDNKLMALYGVDGIDKKTDWDGVIDMLRRKVGECSKTQEKFQLEFSENPYGALSWGSSVMEDSARLYCIAHLITMMEHMVKGEHSMFRDEGFTLSKWIKEVAMRNVVSRIISSSSNASNEMDRIKHNIWVEFAQGWLY